MGTSGAGNAANFIAGRSESVTSPSPSYCEIPLSQGLVATVDAANFDYLNQWKWYAIWKENCRSFYAVRNAVVDGKKTTIYMHRQILGLSHGDTRKGDQGLSNQPQPSHLISQHTPLVFRNCLRL